MLFSMIAFFSCHIMVIFVIPCFSSMRKCQSIIALHIATDLFVRDIRALDSAKTIWKYTSPHEIVWHEESHDIGWNFKNNCLERKEGVYHQGWIKQNTSMVATGINQAHFKYEKKENNIIAIELSLIPAVTREKPVTCYIAIRRKEKT